MNTLIKAVMSAGLLVIAASKASAQTTVRFYTEAPQIYYPVVEQPRYPPLRFDDQDAYVSHWQAQQEWQARREWRERREQQLRREQWQREQEWRRSHWQHAEQNRNDWQQDQWRHGHRDEGERD